MVSPPGGHSRDRRFVAEIVTDRLKAAQRPVEGQTTKV